jgi:hypothetical protein
MSLISLLVGSLLAILGLYLKVDLLGLSALVGVFVGSGFTGKVAQKFAETKIEPSGGVEKP